MGYPLLATDNANPWIKVSSELDRGYLVSLQNHAVEQEGEFENFGEVNGIEILEGECLVEIMSCKGPEENKTYDISAKI